MTKREENAEKVLKNFVDTIDATGGVRETDNGCTAPAIDLEWTDLGDVYLQACAWLGKKPKYVENDDE